MEAKYSSSDAATGLLEIIMEALQQAMNTSNTQWMAMTTMEGSRTGGVPQYMSLRMTAPSWKAPFPGTYAMPQRAACLSQPARFMRRLNHRNNDAKHLMQGLLF